MMFFYEIRDFIVTSEFSKDIPLILFHLFYFVYKLIREIAILKFYADIF